MTRDLSRLVMVITGASSGIGAATAAACAEAGMDLVINARRADRLETVADQIRRHGRRVEVVTGSVTGPGFSARLLDGAAKRFGRFDVVFANAGYGIKKSVLDLSDRELRAIFDVNFFAANDLLRQAARRLIADRRRGHLLMCSSSVARFSLPRYGAYCATKAAQAHVCAAMRLELKPHRIHVTSVHPITTRTEFFDVARQHTDGGEDGSSLLQETPNPFIQSPEKVARGVVACLRRPRAEVWTSHTVRILAGLITVFPSLLDRVAGRQAANPRSSAPGES